MVDQEDEEGPFEEFCMARLPAQNISIIDNASQQATNTSSIIENRKSDTTERRLNEIEIDKNKSLNSKEVEQDFTDRNNSSGSNETEQDCLSNDKKIESEDKSCQTLFSSESVHETLPIDQNVDAEVNCKIDHSVKSDDTSFDWIENEPIMDRMIGNKNESDIEICGVKCKALIDTGSSMTTLSQSFYDSMHKKPELLSFDTFKLDIRAAGGTQVTI